MKAVVGLLFLTFASCHVHNRFGGNRFMSPRGNFFSDRRQLMSEFNNGVNFGNQIGDVGGFPADFIGAPALGVSPSANDLGIDNAGLGVSAFDGFSSDRSGRWGSQGSGFSSSSWDNGGFDTNFGQQDFPGGSQWQSGGNQPSSFTSGGFNDLSYRPSHQRGGRRPRYWNVAVKLLLYISSFCRSLIKFMKLEMCDCLILNFKCGNQQKMKTTQGG